MKSLILSALMVLGLATPALAQQVNIQMNLGGRGGQITVNANGMTITFGGNRMYRRRISMSAPGSLTIGSRVYSSGGTLMTVAGMNPTTGVISLTDQYGYTSSSNLSDLAVTDGCDGVFCIGESTITNGDSAGTISGFFADGRVVVIDQYGYSSILPATSLSLTDACSGYFCTGDTVITSGNTTGTVAGIFSDGSIVVKDQYGYMSNNQAASLSVTTAICATIYVDRVDQCRR